MVYLERVQSFRELPLPPWADTLSASGSSGSQRTHQFKRRTAIKIYIGNLSFNTGEEELRNAFSPYGTVGDATVITDRDTGRSRGFGFVEIAGDDAARAAIKALNGADLDGRNVTVNEAKPRTDTGRTRSYAGRS